MGSAARQIGAFEVVSVPYGDKARPAGRVRCAASGCDAFLDIPATSAGDIVPTLLAKKAIGHGWDVHPNRKSHCRCPAHAKTKGTEKTEMATNLTPAPAQMVQHPSSRPALSLSALSLPRPATTEERLKIRSALDKHFDDSRGIYLEGMSDEKIAVAVGVPRKIVEDIREAAYGPIRVDTELVEMRAEIARLAASIADGDCLAKKIAEEIKGLHSAQDRLASTLAQLRGSIASMQLRVNAKLGA